MSSAISLDHLTIGYRSHAIASNLNATIYDSSLTCLLGTNGMGKSTLLRTIAGLQPAISGEVSIRLHDDDDQMVAVGNIARQQLACTVSVVLTEKLDVRQLTVTEVVGMGRMPYVGFFGGLTAEDHQIVSDSLAAVGMEAFADRQIETLSDGERQKVMIAKALAQQTPIILLDEPTAFLDYPSKVEMMKLLHQLASTQHKTTLLSTHDLELAVAHADHLLMLQPEPHPSSPLYPISHEELQSYINGMR